MCLSNNTVFDVIHSFFLYFSKRKNENEMEKFKKRHNGMVNKALKKSSRGSPTATKTK